MIKKIVIGACGLLLIIVLAMVGHAEYLEVASRAALYAATIDHLNIDKRELEETIASLNINQSANVKSYIKQTADLEATIKSQEITNDILKKTVIAHINETDTLNQTITNLKKTVVSLIAELNDTKTKNNNRSNELIAEYYKLNEMKNSLEAGLKDQQQINADQLDSINLLIEKLRVLSDKTADAPKVYRKHPVTHHRKHKICRHR